MIEIPDDRWFSMLTLFSIPKSFHGHIAVIQRNAIKSWIHLRPRCEVVLLGDDEGTAKIATEFKLRYISSVAHNQYGTPLVNSVFSEAEKLASYPLMCYVNADIVLMSDFLPAVQQVLQHKPCCLMIGRRWDVDIKEPIGFSANWEERLKSYIIEDGKLHAHTGIDFFVFPKGLFGKIPPFALGRTAWDNWLIYRIRSLGIPVIDATKIITAVHQNHDYSHCAGGEIRKGSEAQRNFQLAGGFSNMLSLREADWILTKDGLEKPRFPRRIFVKLSLFYPWRLALSIKRKLQHLLR